VTKKDEARAKAASLLSNTVKRLAVSVKYLTEAGLAQHATSVGEALKHLESVTSAVGDPPAKVKRQQVAASRSATGRA
jgi:hypothetical protein